MIRIAQVLNRMDNGGIEAVVMNYYRSIDHNKIQFDFYFSEESSFPQEDELKRMGAGIYKIPPYTKVFAYQKALQKAFSENRYTIVHSHLSTMSLFPLLAAWKAHVPVRICHNHSTAEKGEGKKTILKYVLRPWNRLFATHYFACGEKTARWMYGNRNYEKKKVLIMPNAIKVNHFVYNEEDRFYVRKELGIPQNAIIVGHVGRFTYAKNHWKLLNIFQKIQTICATPIYLLLVGEGELYDEIYELAHTKNLNAIFAGSRKDVNRMYSAMDVFCMPSFYEGMPVVAWEAQANGLCCIFSDKVTDEAAVFPKCQFLNLNDSDNIWAEAVLEGARSRANHTVGVIPDIHEWAKWLEQFYLSVDSKK